MPLNAPGTASRPPSDPSKLPNIAVFASGAGSTLRALHDACSRGAVAAKIGLVISNNSKSGAMEYAIANGLAARHLSPIQFNRREDHEQQMLDLLIESKAVAIVLAGYMKLVPLNVVERYHNRILNVHPALLPAFGGPGMYGDKVHEALLKRGCKVSGATVHLVNAEYDSGPIVLQEACDVHEDETVDSLKSKVRQIEHRLLPRAVDLLVRGKIQVTNNKVRILE